MSYAFQDINLCILLLSSQNICIYFPKLCSQAFKFTFLRKTIKLSIIKVPIRLVNYLFGSSQLGFPLKINVFYIIKHFVY